MIVVGVQRKGVLVILVIVHYFVFVVRNVSIMY